MKDIQLPVEIISVILTHLVRQPFITPPDLIRLSRINSSFYKAATTLQFWQNICDILFFDESSCARILDTETGQRQHERQPLDSGALYYHIYSKHMTIRRKVRKLVDHLMTVQHYQVRKQGMPILQVRAMEAKMSVELPVELIEMYMFFTPAELRRLFVYDYGLLSLEEVQQERESWMQPSEVALMGEGILLIPLTEQVGFGRLMIAARKASQENASTNNTEHNEALDDDQAIVKFGSVWLHSGWNMVCKGASLSHLLQQVLT